MSKYYNEPTMVDGIKFASKKEAARYGELKLLKLDGRISNIKVHPAFTLQESFKCDRKTVRAITYTADFQYQEHCGGYSKTVVEDVKGGKATRTQAFEIKRKLFLRKFPEIELRIV